MNEGFRRQWADLHKRTADKLVALGMQLTEYHCGDVFAWFDGIPKDAAFVSYPPFYDTGSGGYTALYKRISRVFEWDKPDFEPMDDTRLKKFVENATDRKHWLLGLKDEHPDLEPYLRAFVQPTPMNTMFRIYSSAGQTRIAMPELPMEPYRGPKLETGDRLTEKSKIELRAIPPRQAAWLRAQHINKAIKTSGAGYSGAMGVFVDEKLAGLFLISTSSVNPAAFQDLSAAYMLMDFGVASSDYARLSKLVLYAALSREAQLITERGCAHRVRSINSTAFSNNAVSMKYRGLMKLTTRTPIKPGEGDFKFKLNYQGEAGRWTLSEGFALWFKKHGGEFANATPSD